MEVNLSDIIALLTRRIQVMRRIGLLALTCLPMCAADAHVTAEERTKVINWLEESRKEFLAAIDGVTEEQWKWKPAPERWSVGETAEHIVLAEAACSAIARRRSLRLRIPSGRKRPRARRSLSSR